MSEIKCNKLEITSLRHCDSIKIRGNIGPCIIEGPVRQDSCQACQPCCSYWIWPVTHTQISPVKITGYIDFLFLFVSACECAECVSVYVCANVGVHVCVSSLHACVHIYCTVYMYSNMCTHVCLSVYVLYVGVLTCAVLQGQDINQVWETMQGWELQPHLELQLCRSGASDVEWSWGELWANTQG